MQVSILLVGKVKDCYKRIPVPKTPVIQIKKSTKKTLNSFDQTPTLISLFLSSFLNTSIAAYLNQEKVTRKVMAPNAKSRV